MRFLIKETIGKQNQSYPPQLFFPCMNAWSNGCLLCCFFACCFRCYVTWFLLISHAFSFDYTISNIFFFRTFYQNVDFLTRARVREAQLIKSLSTIPASAISRKSVHQQSTNTYIQKLYNYLALFPHTLILFLDI